MTYKNEVKGYLLLAVIYGIPMGILLGLINKSILVGIFVGILGGLLFGFSMFLFNKPMEKKFAKMRAEMEKEKTVICDGAATILGNGGWIFLSETEMVFCPHKLNLSTKKISISLSDIESVKVQKGKLFITTNAETPIVAVVCRADEWKKHIEAAIEKTAQK